MLVVWGFFDRFLDMVGIASIVYWTFKGASRWAAWRHSKTTS